MITEGEALYFVVLLIVFGLGDSIGRLIRGTAQEGKEDGQ